MLYVMIFLLLSSGIFMISSDILKLPPRSIVKARVNLKKRISAGRKSALDIRLEGISSYLSKYVKLGPVRSEELDELLRSQDMDVSPEVFIANCFLKALMIALLSIPALFILPISVPFILIVSAMVFFNLYRRPVKLASKKKTEIEICLPGFVNHTGKILKHSRDVLYIISSYSEYASGVFAHELLVTEADMRSGNYELALTRLEARVGSTMLSDVTRGLISIIHGDDTSEYWKNLSVKFSDYQKQLLKQKALRVPSKVRRLSLALMIIFMLLYLVVMGTVIITSLSALF
ncbi:MAG: secretion protein F [Clostridia bacterium]|nr:secretion protein F [Clostridia bacterium]